MENQYLKKIIAQTPEDLHIISACCSEGKVNIDDVKYLASNKIFLISIARFSKEEKNKDKLINSNLTILFNNLFLFSSSLLNLAIEIRKILLEAKYLTSSILTLPSEQQAEMIWRSSGVCAIIFFKYWFSIN